MIARVALVAVIGIACGTGGCTATRQITPWLRASTTTHFERGFIAESGGVGPYDTGKVERYDGQAWVPLHVDDMRAFGFAGGSRAVVGTTLLRRDGPPVSIPCAQDLRATPDDAGLVCVEIFGRTLASWEHGATNTVRVTQLDADGRVLGTRTVAAPVEVPAGAPVEEDASASFLGFDGDGLWFSVLRTDARTSFASGAPLRCQGFVLGKDDRWRAAATLSTTADALWRCNFARPWNQALGTRIDPGKVRRDARGEPHV